jgi:hypothetical protein
MVSPKLYPFQRAALDFLEGLAEGRKAPSGLLPPAYRKSEWELQPAQAEWERFFWRSLAQPGSYISGVDLGSDDMTTVRWQYGGAIYQVVLRTEEDRKSLLGKSNSAIDERIRKTLEKKVDIHRHTIEFQSYLLENEHASKILTPLALSVALHYHGGTTKQHHNLHIKPYRQAAEGLADHGLLERIAEIGCGSPVAYKGTDKLTAYIDALTSVPFPQAAGGFVGVRFSGKSITNWQIPGPVGAAIKDVKRERVPAIGGPQVYKTDLWRGKKFDFHKHGCDRWYDEYKGMSYTQASVAASKLMGTERLTTDTLNRLKTLRRIMDVMGNEGTAS